ncbi:MAG: MFS transporter [Bacillota bacterium]
MENIAAVSKPLRYRWVILALCAACFLFTFITRFTWPPLIPVVVPVLGMKMSQAGAFMSAFYIGYVITQIPAGVLADRFGVRLILAGSLILEGISTSALGYISTYEMGFNLRILSGLGAGAVFASCSRALMEWFPENERGRAFGVFLAAPSGGILMTNLMVPPLNQALGWNGAFQAVGSLTIIAGVMVFLFMRSAEEIKGEDKSLLSGLKIFFSGRNLILTALAGFCLMWLELGMATWANAYIKKLGFSVTAAGQVMVFYGIGGVLAPLVSGFVSDLTGQRKWLIITAYLAVIPLTVIFGYQKDLTMLSVLGFVLGFCSYVANPQLTVLISQFAGKEWAATANGVSNFMFQLASLISPWLIGMVIDVTGNFSWVWFIMAAGPLLGLILMLPVKEAGARA